MAAKLRPPIAYHDRCGLKPPNWLKPAAVSFSGLLDGVRSPAGVCDLELVLATAPIATDILGCMGERELKVI
jgi:hypothetical protein